MFVTVKHGAGQTEIFNHHCRIVNFMDYIKQRCGLGAEECIDLVDEAGHLMNLSVQQNSLEQASNILMPRRRYILIRVLKQDDPETVKYEAMLDNIERLHPVVADHLRKLSNPKTKEKEATVKKHRATKEVILSPSAKNKSAFRAKNTTNTQRRF
ncbi:uncharacterized protein C22orf15-like [Leucoraja erinacea]|uniref:uncharacterized protein C22orf15-like n=1 Tax=Leucoraja erinaceus TaxID=7782 RepID=UPI0024538ACE|nr:uncharacterized protein C22orf15-like [Leucoraja erinacea]